MKIHVFPFSTRKGTPAADYPDQVDPKIKKNRCDTLSVLDRELALDYYQQHLEKPLEVMIEREIPESPGWVKGTDRHYIPVEVPGTKMDIGTFVHCYGEKATKTHMQAKR